MFTTNDVCSNNTPLEITLQHDTNGNLMEADRVESVFTRSDNTNQTSNSSSNIISKNQQTITNQLPLLREQSSIYSLQVEPVPNSSTTKLCLISKYERDIPVYLIGTHCTFEQLITKQKNATIHSVNINILRKIALLIYRKFVIDFEKSVWLAYLKCGTGTLQSESSNNNSFKYWPKKLKTIIQSTKIIDISETSFTNETYMNVVQTYLQQLDNRKQQYEIEIVEITKSITNYHRVIQPIIEKFILQQLYSLHVKTIYRTKFIYNEYEYHRLQSILNQTKLNNDQIQEISHLCHSIYAYQESKQEFTLLVHYMRQSKDLLRVSDTIKDINLPAHFKIMQNQDIRQQFIELHRTNLDHYQNRMKKSLLNLAKIRMNEKQKLFDDAQTNSKQKQHNLPLCQQFNWIIRDTIQLILSNITESLRTMYQLKTFELLGKISLN